MEAKAFHNGNHNHHDFVIKKEYLGDAMAEMMLVVDLLFFF